MSDGFAPGGGRHHFFEAISLSIALSSSASANSFFSLAFSSSSAFNRLASDVWTADPKRVLAAVKRGKQTLESVHSHDC